MLTKKLILDPQYSKYIYYTTWVMLFTALYGIYKEYYTLGYLTFVVFCSSINYWRNPIDNIIRVIDLTISFSAVFFTLYYVQYCKHLYVYYLLLSFIGFCYFASKYYRYQKNYMYCTMYHCGVHLTGNLCSLLIYNKIIDCSCYLEKK